MKNLELAMDEVEAKIRVDHPDWSEDRIQNEIGDVYCEKSPYNKTLNEILGRPERFALKHYFERNRDNPEFTLVKHGDRLSVAGELGYFYFGTVAGCAANDYGNTEAAIARARENRHQLVWVGALCSVIDCSGRTGEQKAMDGAPLGATMHNMNFGQVVWLEGQTYRLDRAPNHNVGLTPVIVYAGGELEKGSLCDL
jgi:hypothetical protein